MPNLLETGSRWLAGKRKDYMSTTAVYARGSATIPSILLTKGKTDFQLVDGDSSMPVEGRMEDFLADAADLVIDGQITKPARGDKITFNTIVYEVLDIPEGACWRYEDALNEVIRIHTKRITA